MILLTLVTAIAQVMRVKLMDFDCLNNIVIDKTDAKIIGSD